MTRYMRASLILGTFGLVGCASMAAQTRSDGAHPADPRALAAPVLATRMGIGPDEYDSPFVGPKEGKEPDRVVAPKEPSGDSMPMHQRGMPSGAANGPAGVKSSPRPSPGQVDQPSGAKEVYACPMHPEVTDSKLSKCPKCGMTLVRRKDGQ